MADTSGSDIEALADLERFDPKAFTARHKSERECANFVLALALAFNDLKDLLSWLSRLNEEAPEHQISKERGAFGGAHTHLLRLLIGTLHEIMYLIEKNPAIVDGEVLGAVVKKLSKRKRASWLLLVDSARASSGPNRGKDAKFLVNIRNAVAFHYGPKALGNGYEQAFFGRKDDPFISRGESIRSTRFYFADRAAQAYMEGVFGKRELENYFVDRPDLVGGIGRAIFGIVTLFVESRGYDWQAPS